MSKRKRTTSLAVIESHERMAEALRMRHGGADYQDIATALSVTPATARTLVAKALTTFAPVEEAESMRDLEASRLNKAQSAIWDQVVSGDLMAIKTFLAISERRSKLLGLDAPAKLAVAIVDGSKEADEARERLRRIIADEQGRSLLMEITKKFVDGDTIDVEAIEVEQPNRTNQADSSQGRSIDAGTGGDGTGSCADEGQLPITHQTNDGLRDREDVQDAGDQGGTQ